MEKINSKKLSSLVPNLNSVLEYHSCILDKALKGVRKPLSDIVLVEYGGGLGFQSLLARKLGIGTVVYIDIDSKICKLAQEIAGEAGLKADTYICGDVDMLIDASIKADVITSNDVLEHIYNIDYDLGRLSLVCQDGAVMFHCSGANMFWYPYVKHSGKLQWEAEHIGVEEYNTGPFLKERERVIRELEPNWPEEKVKDIAIRTRGLMQDSIALEIEWMDFGHVIEPEGHPTNTCNPYTGNWAERSMNPYYLAEILGSVGFEVSVEPVPFEKVGKSSNDLVRSTLNTLIKASNSLYFSSKYAIYAKYTGVPSTVKPTQNLYKYPISPVINLVKVPYELVSLICPRKSYYSPQFGEGK